MIAEISFDGISCNKSRVWAAWCWRWLTSHTHTVHTLSADVINRGCSIRSAYAVMIYLLHVRMFDCGTGFFFACSWIMSVRNSKLIVHRRYGDFCSLWVIITNLKRAICNSPVNHVDRTYDKIEFSYSEETQEIPQTGWAISSRSEPNKREREWEELESGIGNKFVSKHGK